MKIQPAIQKKKNIPPLKPSDVEYMRYAIKRIDEILLGQMRKREQKNT